ncbi:hypothetical protein D5R81_13420 [Parashewanella spongiae]|uniref:Uncharacterized protein n=2 Tax=Parashewanella spongiae TaxID=342950 RepID=A0A3A6U560_9GAMM|nr:hypothetical protein [Parashewanella spongiae]RJY11330.1 hypothetical protein D5R81_13420 [Parashewanella spongiae]
MMNSATKDLTEVFAPSFSDELKFSFELIKRNFSVTEREIFDKLFESNNFQQLKLSEQVSTFINEVKKLPLEQQEKFKYQLNNGDKNTWKLMISYEGMKACWCELEVSDQDEEREYIQIKLFAEQIASTLNQLCADTSAQTLFSERELQQLVCSMIENDANFPLSKLADRKTMLILSEVGVFDTNLAAICSEYVSEQNKHMSQIELERQKKYAGKVREKQNLLNEYDDVFMDEVSVHSMSRSRTSTMNSSNTSNSTGSGESQKSPQDHNNESIESPSLVRNPVGETEVPRGWEDYAENRELTNLTLAEMDAQTLKSQVQRALVAVNDYKTFEALTIQQIVKDNKHIRKGELLSALDNHTFCSDALVDITSGGAESAEKEYWKHGFFLRKSSKSRSMRNSDDLFKVTFVRLENSVDEMSLFVRNEMLFLKRNFDETSSDFFQIVDRASAKSESIDSINQNDAVNNKATRQESVSHDARQKAERKKVTLENIHSKRKLLLENKSKIEAELGRKGKTEKIQLESIENELAMLTVIEERLMKSSEDLSSKKTDIAPRDERAQLQQWAKGQQNKNGERNLVADFQVLKVNARSLRGFIQTFYHRQLSDMVTSLANKSSLLLKKHLQHSEIQTELRQVSVGNTNLYQICLNCLLLA